MSNKIKEALSIIVALGLVAVMQYFAAKDCYGPGPGPGPRHPKADHPMSDIHR